MRVKMIANELVDGEIDFVSLVKHGANQTPFKIIKMEDLPESGGLMDKLTSIFGDEPAEVSAFFVKNEELTTYEPMLKKAGFKVDDTQKMRDVTIYKQDNFDGEADVSLIALDNNLGLALDKVVKQFSSYPESADFKENLGASSFFPSLHQSFEALAESTWNALNNAVNVEEASTVIDKNLMAFRKHVNVLVKNLPQSVIKFESELLRSSIEGSTLSTVDGDVAKSGDKDMTKINEAMAGDLGTLNAAEESDAEKLAKAEATAVAAAAATETDKVSDAEDTSVQIFDEEGKAQLTKEEFDALGDDAKVLAKVEDGEDKVVAKADVLGMGEGAFVPRSVGASVVTETTDTGAVDRDEGLPAGYREVQKDVMKFEDGKLIKAVAKFLVNDETKDEVFVEYVEKAEDETEADDSVAQIASVLAGPLDLIGKAMNKQAETLVAINTRLEKQDEKIEALQKSTDEKIEKTEELTLVQADADLDQSFGLLGRTTQVVKEDLTTDPFIGLCPELDALAASMPAQS